VGLIAVMPILFQLGFSFTNILYESTSAGSTILEDISARPILALTMFAGMASGASAFISGLLAIFRHKENTLLVYAATLFGGLVILYLTAEMFFPH
jgi:hypothetical protein